MFCTHLTDKAFLPASCFGKDGEWIAVMGEKEERQDEKEEEKEEKEEQEEQKGKEDKEEKEEKEEKGEKGETEKQKGKEEEKEKEEGRTDSSKRKRSPSEIKARDEKITKKYGVSESTMLYSLKTLYIGGCSAASENSVISLVSRAPRLSTLSVPALDISDLTMLHIAKSVPRLQHLNVALCANITPVGIRGTVRSCKNMKFLDVSGIETFDDSVLDEISENCENLKTLDISKTFFYSPEVVLGLVKKLKHSLTLIRMRARSDEETYSEDFIQSLSECAPNLTIFRNY
jgi:flagellar biosynthesis GTPase FlhF